MKTCKCKFCGKTAPTNMQGYCQVCYHYFVQEGKKVYPLPADGKVEKTENGDVICHECGKAFRKLGGHIHQAHGMTTTQYCVKHGLKLRGPRASKLSNKDYQEHMKAVQDPKTISINLIEGGKDHRFNGVNGNKKELPTHSFMSRCKNCQHLVADIDDWFCGKTEVACRYVMKCSTDNLADERRK